MINSTIYTYKHPYRYKTSESFRDIHELEATMMVLRLAGELVGVQAYLNHKLVYEWWDRKARGNWATADYDEQSSGHKY